MTKKSSALYVSAFIASSALLSGCSLLSTTPQATVGEGWQLVWHDEFDGSDIDATKWDWETNCWGGGNNEQQCYTDRPENSFIRDGKLVIKAQKEQFTGPAEPLEWESNAGETTLPYTSARLRTLNQGDWTFGRIEVRAKIPGGQGVWPAIWMLPTDWKYGGWASSGEIDIMEAVNLTPGGENSIHGTLHYGRDWPANVSSGTHYDFDVENDPTAVFHTYAIEWANGEIRWYVDDVHFATQRSQGWYSQSTTEDGSFVTNEGAAPFDERFHLLLNVAVGGNWPGMPDDSTPMPAEMEVDFVRVFSCPESPYLLNSCATKDRKATRVWGNEVPVEVKVEYDVDLNKADVVSVFAEQELPPFTLGQYVANGSVDMSYVDDGEHGQVARLQFNTDESVVYYQAPVGIDFSEFDRVEFDLKVVADPRAEPGMVMKVDCFYPCGTGDYPIEAAPVGEWKHFSISLQDLLKHPGSKLDLTSVNTPLVIFPSWGNQRGVVLHLDNVKYFR